MAPPQRMKNSALKVNEHESVSISSIGQNWLESSNNTKSELEYLQYLKAKKDLGLLTEEQVKALSRNTDATTNLEIKLLMRLQKFSEYSPEWAQITAIFGSRDRLAIARSLAAKYTQSAALKLVLSNVTGAEQAELGNLGLAEVRADLDAQDTSNPMLDSRSGQEQL